MGLLGTGDVNHPFSERLCGCLEKNNSRKWGWVFFLDDARKKNFFGEKLMFFK